MSKTRQRGVLFDLDGTLLNTLEDLADAANSVLAEAGFEVHPLDNFRRLVGSGAEELMRRALPEDRRDQATVSSCHARLVDIYTRNCFGKTVPYEGIRLVIDSLFERGIPVGVVTNKPHEAAIATVEHYFPQLDSSNVIGQRPDFPVKPDPAMAQEMCLRLAVAPEESLFVGDSDVDMYTAIRAGMRGVGAVWGFRGEQELADAGAWALVRQPEEILELV